MVLSSIRKRSGLLILVIGVAMLGFLLTDLMSSGASLFQKGDRSNAEIKLLEFNKIIEENDLKESDIILVNWSAYTIYDSLGESKKAKNSLENAYFEIKSKSKEIKNKDDRNLYLSTEINKNILNKWEAI